MKPLIGKILYGTFFCVVFPALLFVWARSVAIDLPMGNWTTLGISLLVFGSVLFAVAVGQLWFVGKGLPMNAFPPSVYVASGAYFYFRHPIYVAFCLLSFGTAILLESPAGFYLVSPMVSLLCWALVKGYEEPDLKRRFERQIVESSNRNDGLSSKDKMSVIAPIFLIWLAGYELFVFIGFNEKYGNTVTTLDSLIPLSEWAEVPYFLTYFFVMAAPWFIRTRNQLRDFKSVASWVVAIGLFLFWILPLYSAPRALKPETWLGELIIWERGADSPAAAFPSFHVLWSLVSARVLIEVFPRQKLVWVFVCVAIAWSCLATGAHSLLDVLAAFVVFVVVVNRTTLWRLFQTTCEKLANSWREIRIGGLRIISHAIFSGLAAILGTFLVGQFFPRVDLVLWVVVASFVGGALWGQLVEGSPRLLRPFGFFGALAGGVVACVVLFVARSESPFVVLASFALAAPWTQAIGRLRCLVQGCCHGKLVDQNSPGIVYTNPHSRVCAIAHLRGRPLHNTQGYSILMNLIIGLVLLRVWYGGGSVSLLTGLYFMLTGISRFVEEAYRGEPQTKKIAGLPLYQWLAVGFVILGGAVTTVNDSSVLTFQWNFSGNLFIVSLGAGLLWAFGMSMDFPKANIPFSRLTG